MLRHEHYVNKTKWDKFRDQLKGIGSAILIALLIRVFLVEPYKIPTPSMYPTILEGDMIMASKFWYGVRIPVVNLKLPAFSSPDSGDIILFETPTYRSPGKWTELLNFVTFGLFGLDNTSDNPKYFIKRAVAVPGDILTLHDPRDNQFQYQIELNGKKMPLKPTVFPDDFRGKEGFQFYSENLSGILHYVQYDQYAVKNPSLFLPKHIVGNIYIPKEGDRITFTLVQSHDNLAEVKKAMEAGNPDPALHAFDRVKLVIENGSDRKEVETTGTIMNVIYFTQEREYKNSILTAEDIYQLILNGKAVKEVEEDYFFAMGDNRDNSSDSRFWGLVNQSLLLGSPMFRHYPFSRFGGVDATPTNQ